MMRSAVRWEDARTVEQDVTDRALTDVSVAAIYEVLAAADRNERPSDAVAQKALARLVRLLPEIRDAADPGVANSGLVAARALTAAEPRTHLGSAIVRDLDRRLLQSPSGDVISAAFLSGVALVASISALFAAGALFAQGNGRLPRDLLIFGVPLYTVVLVTAAAAVGSVVSLITRASDYNTRTFATRKSLYLEAASRPLVGIAFGWFIYAVVTGGLITQFTVPSGEDAWRYPIFWFAISFAVGFSERLGKDIVTKAEGLLGAVEAKGATTPTQARDAQPPAARVPAPRAQ
jgi:hypothetical protein